MTQSEEAVYENGALWPLEPLEGVREHSRVRLQVEADAMGTHPLAGVFGTLSDEDADEMLKAIEEEFETIHER